MAHPDAFADAAPIALFVFRRADLARNAIHALKACDGFDPARLWVFSDGPKHQNQAADVEAVRHVVREEVPEAHIIEQAQNQGLARSIIAGVNLILDQSERVIVLEDDLIVAKDFLTWMDSALAQYADDDQVMQISGHMFGVDVGPDPVFLPFISTWGWASWRRAWTHFDPELPGADALDRDRSLRRRFDVNGAYPYSKMMRDQLAGKVDSWGIVWNWSVFHRSGLVLYPPVSRVRNAGMDGRGTHGSRGASQKLFDGRAADEPMPRATFPRAELSTTALRKIASALRFEQLAKLIRRFLP